MSDQTNTARNVTQSFFPCPVCKRLQRLEVMKNGKPYLTCNDCLVQLFFRGKEGIRKLHEMIGKEGMSGDVQGFTSLLEHMAFLKKELSEFKENKSLFDSNPELKIEKELIEVELKRIRLVLSSELKIKKAEIRKLQAAQKKGS